MPFCYGPTTVQLVKGKQTQGTLVLVDGLAGLVAWRDECGGPRLLAPVRNAWKRIIIFIARLHTLMGIHMSHARAFRHLSRWNARCYLHDRIVVFVTCGSFASRSGEILNAIPSPHGDSGMNTHYSPTLSWVGRELPETHAVRAYSYRPS